MIVLPGSGVKRVLDACRSDKEQSATQIFKIAKVSSGTGEKHLKKLVKHGYVTMRVLTPAEKKLTTNGMTKNVWKRTDKELKK